MIRSRAAFGMVGLIVLVSASASADSKKHEEKYCKALGEFSSDLKTLQGIGSDSTLKDLREASEKVEDDAYKVVREGGKIKSPTGRKFKDSAHQLRYESYSLPENLTIQQARTRIEDNTQNVWKAGRQLAQESGCPEAVPPLETLSGTAKQTG